MEEVKITKEQILALYTAENTDQIKEMIEEDFPEAVRPQFQKGVWYIDNTTPNIHLFRHTGGFDRDGDPLGYGMVGDTWYDVDPEWGFSEVNTREATPSEVRTHLTRLLRKLGYKEGVKCKNHQGTWTIRGDAFDVIIDPVNNPDGIYSVGSITYGGWIMMNGEWAEILPPEPQKVEKQVGKWYTNDLSSRTSVFYVAAPNREYGVETIKNSGKTEWIDNDFEYYGTENLKEATFDQVQEALHKESIKRGLVKGARVGSLLTKGVSYLIDKDDRYSFNDKINDFRLNRAVKSKSNLKDVLVAIQLFKDGVWAEVVEGDIPSQEEIARVLKYLQKQNG